MAMTSWPAAWQRLLNGDEPPYWRASGQAALALLLALLAVLLLPVDRWLDGRHDHQARWYAPMSPADSALVVDVDEASVKRLGGWPLPREQYVPAGQWLQAAGARAVVLSMVLADARDGDARMADWLSASRMPVLLAARSVPGDGQTQPAQSPGPGCKPTPVAGWQLPVWARTEAGAPPLVPISRVGTLSLPVADDDMLRQWPLWQQAGSLALPVLPLAAWQALAPQAAVALVCDSEAPGATAGGPGGQRHSAVWPLLAQDTGRQPVLPLAMLLDAVAGKLSPEQTTALAARVQGRVVFIGSTAALANSVVTPLGSLPGTMVMAAAFDALTHGRLLKAPKPAVNAALCGVLLLPWLAGLWRRRPRLRTELAWLVGAGLLLMLGDNALVAGDTQLSHIGLPATALALWAALVLGLHHLRALDERRRLQLAQASAQAANEAKTEFLAHVSHEVRTPLNALLGAADLLAHTPLNDSQARYVSLFRSAGQELLQMLNDLLDLSKIEAGLLTLDRVPFSLTRLVAGQVMLFEARAQQKGLQLLIDALPDLPEVVVGDGPRLGQVLRNLLSNAVKFTSVGSVTLAVARGAGGHGLRFEVRDTGIGVPPDRVDEIFAPFVQSVHPGQARQRGTGLGLAISRRLVQAMGGQIGVTSVEGLGSTFYVELPLPATTAPPRADIEADAPATTLLSASPDLKPMRLLLVDDSPLNIVLTQTYLEGFKHRIDVVHDGAAALRRFDAEPYQVVLMDLHMPVMSGLEAARQMRELEARRQRPPALLVAVTGQVAPDEVAAARAAGFDLHLGKPYSRNQLLATLAHHALSLGGHDSRPTVPSRQMPETRISAISQLPDADLGEALGRLGSEALYNRLLDAAGDTLQHFDQRLASLLDAMPCDLDGAQRLAHDLRSMAATLGLQGLASDARRLDRALADTITPTEDPVVASARRAVQRRLVGLQQALAQSGHALPSSHRADAAAISPPSGDFATRPAPLARPPVDLVSDPVGERESDPVSDPLTDSPAVRAGLAPPLRGLAPPRGGAGDSRLPRR